MCEINKKYNKAVDALDDKDFTKAYTSFLSLAEQDYTDAQKAIAYMLLNGLGAKRNKQRAYDWYLKAAELGDAEAQYFAAIIDLESDNTERGLKLLRLSMDNGCLYAIYWLGCIYLDGLYSIEVDLLKAEEFFRIAIQNRVEDASEKLFKTKVKKLGKMKAMIYLLKNRKIFFPN